MTICCASTGSSGFIAISVKNRPLSKWHTADCSRLGLVALALRSEHRSMRIALIGPPFIEIPPRRYGGTELFIGNLASALDARGHDVTVYANGESSLACEVKW